MLSKISAGLSSGIIYVLFTGLCVASERLSLSNELMIGVEDVLPTQYQTSIEVHGDITLSYEPSEDTLTINQSSEELEVYLTEDSLEIDEMHFDSDAGEVLSDEAELIYDIRHEATAFSMETEVHDAHFSDVVPYENEAVLDYALGYQELSEESILRDELLVQESPLVDVMEIVSAQPIRDGALYSFTTNSERSSSSSLFSRSGLGILPSAAGEGNGLMTDYLVHGKVVLSDSDDLFFDADDFTSSVVFSIIGTPSTESGVTQSATLSGGDMYKGFEIYYTGYSADNALITIKLEGVEYFEDFRNEGTVRAGGVIALYNGGAIEFEQSEKLVSFQDNQVISSDGHASGGAIFITGGGSVTDLRADFINNSTTVIQDSGVTRYARGGAIFVGKYDGQVYDYSPSSVTSSIGNLTGSFQNNLASFGGAIYIGELGDIGHITAEFINNIAEGEVQPDHTQGASGGAIRTWKGTIGSIDSTFSANVAHALTGMAVGGAVSLDGTVVKGGITGDYDGNIAFADEGIARGGAYVLKNQNGDAPIIFTNTNFTNNVAATGLDDITSAQGGALYVENSADIYIVADGEDVLISDNYVVNDATWDATNRVISEGEASIRDYTAFYVRDSVVTLETTAGKNDTITINDGVRDDNNPNTTSELVVRDRSTNKYGVMLNGAIGVDHLIVEEGGVLLGSATHSDGSTTTGSFTHTSNLTAYAGTVVQTNADYLKNVGEVDLRGTTDSAATIEFTGGTLLSDINGVDKDRKGHIDILAKTSVASDAIIYADTINVGDTLYLKEQASVNVDTLFFTGDSMLDVNNGGNQIIAGNLTTFAFDMIALNFAEANPGDVFDLIVANPGEEIVIDFDFQSVVFTVSGKELQEGEDKDYSVLHREDGGVSVVIHIKVLPPVPEPSGVILTLIALCSVACRRRRRC